MFPPRLLARALLGAGLATVLAVSLVAASMLAPQSSRAPQAPSPGTAEAQFVSKINNLRANKGLSQLKVDYDLKPVGDRWTQHMVDEGQISHNPNLANEIPGDWERAGENVGVGYDVDSLFRAFVNSPAHYANLTASDWNMVAVSVRISSDDKIYTTHLFIRRPTGGGGGTPTPTTRPSGGSTPTTSGGGTGTPPPPPPPPPPTTTTTAPPPPLPITPERYGTLIEELRPWL